jgi:hypothetical protein
MLLSPPQYPKSCGDITSTPQANPQSRQQLENKGQEEDFFRCQSRQHTENTATYRKPWGLETNMTKCPTGNPAKGVRQVGRTPAG